MVYFSDLIAYTVMLIALVKLVYDISRKKK